LRGYVLTVLRTAEDIDAMIVMLLINDLGKVKRYREFIEKTTHRTVVDHDEVLFLGLSELPELIPSFLRLLPVQKVRIMDGLKMGSHLNVGQFAQAENLPANLSGVRVLTGKPESFEGRNYTTLKDFDVNKNVKNGKLICPPNSVFQIRYPLYDISGSFVLE
jgi:hypothetical protein